jgi:hypothetical protein
VKRNDRRHLGTEAVQSMTDHVASDSNSKTRRTRAGQSNSDAQHSTEATRASRGGAGRVGKERRGTAR